MRRNHLKPPNFIAKQSETTHFFKNLAETSKIYLREHYKCLATRESQFSPNIQICFNFNERKHYDQLNDANFNDAIGISKFRPFSPIRLNLVPNLFFLF